jgi:hypothetical protein
LFRRARTGAGPAADDTDDALAADDVDAAASADEEPALVTPRRRGKAAARRKAEAAAGSDVELDSEAEPEPEPESDEDLNLKPSTMRGSETMYGYLVALELIVVSIINLTDTHGAGAPTGPQRLFGANISPHSLSVFGLAVSIAVLGIVHWVRHRFVVAFAGIIAAFFVTLPKVPNSLTTTHLVALVIPVVYAFVLTQRQRKDSLARTRQAGGAPARGSAPANRRGDAPAGRRSRKNEPAPTGPKPSSRYTPPKPKRRRPTKPPPA